MVGTSQESSNTMEFFYSTLRVLEEENKARLTKANAERDRPVSSRGSSVDSSASPRHDAANSGDDEAAVKADSTPIDPEDYGMSLGYKQLYSGKEDRLGRYQWTDQMPKDIGEPAEDGESEKWAIIVRRNRVYHNPKKQLALHSIVVQSPLLKDLLGEVLTDYPGVALQLKRLEFDGRFAPLIHRWPALREAIRKLKDSVSQADADSELQTRLEHARLLDTIMIKEFSDIAEAMEGVKSSSVITYNHLWTIFEPGALVYSSVDNQERAFRLHTTKYAEDLQGNPIFWVTCMAVDFDGQRFGMQKLVLKVESFEGHKDIRSLSVCPIEFHDNQQALTAKLMARGAKVESLAGTHYCAYNGVGWVPGQQPNTRDKFNVTGRIVIDGYGYNRYKPNHGIYLWALDSPVGKNSIRTTPSPFEFNEPGDMPTDGFLAEVASDTERRPLTEDQKLICTPFVRGYSLRLKEWLNFFANSVSEIQFNEDAFASLKLPENQKELILGFTQANQVQRHRFDDVIAGKGRGTIILLSGPPGVGKTLTAESVAEKMRVPLFAMAAGDLGLRPRDVESELQTILDMCARWGALALIDEADVFLEARNNHELERNKLVSIFLRVLEYYEGIMFLTSNRTESFDKAFESRIHISLQYKDLDAKARRAIWDTFLHKHNASQAAARANPSSSSSSSPSSSSSSSSSARPLPGAAKLYAARPSPTSPTAQKVEEEEEEDFSLHPHALSAHDLAKLAALPVNGRQIKNFLKMAQLLAAHRKQALAYAHVEDVVDATQHLHKATQASDEAVRNVYS